MSDRRLHEVTQAVLFKLKNRRGLTDYAVAEDIAVSVVSAVEARDDVIKELAQLLYDYAEKPYANEVSAALEKWHREGQ